MGSPFLPNWPYDLTVLKNNPAIAFNPQETGGQFHEFVEVAGALWEAKNALYNGGVWTLINPTLPAYALAFTSTGQYNLYSAPAGTSPLTWVLVGTFQASTSGSGIFNVTQAPFNADPTGVVDATAAIQAADTAAVATGAGNFPFGGVVLFPPGKYKVSATILKNPFVQWIGTNRDTTHLVWAGAASSVMVQNTNPTGGLKTPVNLTIQDMSFDSGGIAGVTALYFLEAAYLNIFRCNFFGMLHNMTLDRCQQFWVQDIVATATSLGATQKVGDFQFVSLSDTDYCSSGLVRNVVAANAGNGTQLRSFYMRRCVGVDFIKCDANDMRTGNGGSPGVGFVVENDCQGLNFIGCILNAGASGMVFQVGSGVAVSPSFVAVAECDFDQSTLWGIQVLNVCTWLTFVGNKITSSGVAGTGGMLISNTCSHIILSANIISGYSAGGEFGLIIGSGVTFVDVIGNDFSNNNSSVNLGGNTQIRILGNMVWLDAFGHVTGTPSGAGNLIRDNVGLILSTNQAPGFPTSTTVVTNTCGYAVRVFVVCGANPITVININGVASGLTLAAAATGFVGILEPDETIAFTYAGGAPTWTWLPIN